MRARLEDALVQALAVGVGLAVVQVARQHAVLKCQADLDQRCAGHTCLASAARVTAQVRAHKAGEPGLPGMQPSVMTHAV